jgi:hypothetical protein
MRCASGPFLCASAAVGTDMITPTCPKCGRVILGEEVNVAADVAYCRACNLSHQLSTVTRVAELEAGVDLNRPPEGAWRRSDGSGTFVGATHRSLGTALATLIFSLFWNGIVSVFVLLALAGTLRHLDIPVPEWFPAPKMDGGPMGAGMTIFLWIFLTPFITVGLVMIGVFLSALAGRTEVQIGRSEASVFSGIGSLGYRRRFDPRSVEDVRIDDRQWRDSDGDRRRKTNIEIETREGRRIKFGSMLTDERRRFVAVAVRRSISA